MLVGTILVITRIDEISTLGLILVIPLIIMVIPTTILMEIIIRCPLILNRILKNLLLRKRVSMLLIEEKLLKIDELARNVDRISLDVDSFKLRSIPHKHDINESLKAMRISIDECKERTARMRAKKRLLCESVFL